jgi:toxin ParE1/3/4
VSRIYTITTAASQDIDAILSRLAAIGSFTTADKFLKTLNAKLKHLTAFPLIGRARPAWGPQHRSIPIDRYVIVYRVTDELVEIIRVMSGYQDLDEFFSDD